MRGLSGALAALVERAASGGAVASCVPTSNVLQRCLCKLKQRNGLGVCACGLRASGQGLVQSNTICYAELFRKWDRQ